MYWKQFDIDYPGCDGAKVCTANFYDFSKQLTCALLSHIMLSFLLQVHHGFYSAYNNTLLRSAVLTAVQQAKEFYGDVKVIVTGHSMGGAIAAFCGLDIHVTPFILDYFLILLCALAFCACMCLCIRQLGQ